MQLSFLPLAIKYVNRITTRLLNPTLSLLLLYASSALPSPVLEERALSPAACSKVVVIVNLLKANRATAFCSFFLGIPAAATTVVVPGVATTVTTGTNIVTVSLVPTVTVTTYVCPSLRVVGGVSSLWYC